MSNSFMTPWLYPTRLLLSMGSQEWTLEWVAISFLQGIFLIQGWTRVPLRISCKHSWNAALNCFSHISTLNPDCSHQLLCPMDSPGKEYWSTQRHFQDFLHPGLAWCLLRFLHCKVGSHTCLLGLLSHWKTSLILLCYKAAIILLISAI